MKKAEFIEFIKDYYPGLSKALSSAEEKFGTSAVIICDNQLFAKALIKNGFNPMVLRDDYDKIFKKYQDEKEVKEAMAKFKEEDRPALK